MCWSSERRKPLSLLAAIGRRLTARLKRRGLMRAMVLHQTHERLLMEERPEPSPGLDPSFASESRLGGVCRTDLAPRGRRAAQPQPSIVPGHEIVGRVDGRRRRLKLRSARASASHGLATPTGLAPIAEAIVKTFATPRCFHPATRATGVCDHTLRRRISCFRFPEDLDPVATAPLLCAGLIGWRSLKLAGVGGRSGVYASAPRPHHCPSLSLARAARLFASTGPETTLVRRLPRSSASTGQEGRAISRPEPLDAASCSLRWGLIPAALAALRKGGRVVCGGIHMTDIRRSISAAMAGAQPVASVANLTREDGARFWRSRRGEGANDHQRPIRSTRRTSA